MSKTNALWSAAILTVVLTLLIGGVLARPIFSKGEEAASAGNQLPVLVQSSGSPDGESMTEPVWWDDAEDDEDDEDHDWSGEREDGDEHESEDEDD